MFQSKYSRVFEPGDVTTTELTPVPSQRKEPLMPLGKPQHKPIFDKVDLLAVLSSIACFIISVCVVSPSVPLSWRLGFENQIVIIGFLLSIMSLCLRRVAPRLFFILEARWGSSRLQNYDAIQTNSILVSQTGLLWRCTLLCLIALPLGLSVAYKRFTGGRSSAVIKSEYLGQYGLSPGSLGGVYGLNNSIYLSSDANIAFLSASSNDSVPPPFTELPRAYGYNTLLIDNHTAALLDMPLPDYVTSIQQKLGKKPSENQSWNITAKVNATVTRYNTTGETFINNDLFWQGLFEVGYPGGELGVFELFNDWNFGTLLGNISETDGTYCLAGSYHNKADGDYWSQYIDDPNDPDSVKFRAAALMFNTRRERCTGTWEITRNSINLTSGFCPGERTNQSIFSDSGSAGQPFQADAMPVLVHTLGGFATDRSKSPWLMPTFATSIANMYWARLAYMYPYQNSRSTSNPEIHYPATDEVIIFVNTTLRASWLLYVVFAIQPLLIIIMFLGAVSFYSTPIHTGFGLVSILSGINRNSLDLLKGAALSGELTKPVIMDIAVCQDAATDQGEFGIGRIEYTIGLRRHRPTELERGKKYS